MVIDGAAHMHQAVGTAANPKLEKVWQLAEPLCLAEGMELVHVEYQREPGGRTLRIYLDKPGGVTLDDCANVSRQLGDILDVGWETDEPYRMEVSSPGSQRPLGKIGDFERFRGSRAKIRITRAIEGRKNFTGTLQGVEQGAVVLVVDDRPMRIALPDIAKAHLIT